MPEFQENSIVEAIEPLAPSLYRLSLIAPRIAAQALPGQFVMAACGATLDPLLRRPLSLHRAVGKETIQLLFKVVGRGTQLLSEVRPGQTLNLIGPLGRGFQLAAQGPITLVGGGIGIAPLLFLADCLRASMPDLTKITVLLGARTAVEVEPLAEEFTLLGCTVLVATDDGSLGHPGLVTGLLTSRLKEQRLVQVCGPTPMMAACAALCQEAGVACEVSLEAHMACGLGACLGCTVHGTGSTYKHVCSHGPVFDAKEVAWSR